MIAKDDRIRILILFAALFSIQVLHADTIPDKGYWLSRFLSVSYPLKTISVTSPYGSRKDPFTGDKKFHSGIDLKANYEPVYAMFKGVVEAVGSDGRSGNHIIVRHGQYTVGYCHLSRRYVNSGDSIMSGDVLGVSGRSGRSTAPHLHLTVKKNGAIVNPRILLTFVKAVREEALAALGITDIAPGTPLSPKAFFEHYAPLAREVKERFRIPVSVTLSQMAHESNFGMSPLARKGNNYFGIKCTRQWLLAGKPFSTHDDDRKGEKFCNYSTVRESVEHYAHILSSERYKSCYRHSVTDYHGWLTAIKRCGYATSDDYVQCCEKIIRQFKLYRYDQA